jgi:hypothetical protein
MTAIAVIDPREITITPVFKYLEIENIPKSETAGHAVMETREVVEVRFAGNKNYAPVFPSDAMWQREGNRVITYAERWPDQYRAFKEGSPQEALGTPLEMLRAQGVTPELISLCRALKIYSIEALYHLEGTPLKSLGMNANRLKEAARAFMAERMSGASALSEIEALRAEIAALKAGVPSEQTPPEVVDAMVAQADATFADMSDEDIKVEIAKLAGSRPKGNPSRAPLESARQELLAA